MLWLTFSTGLGGALGAILRLWIQRGFSGMEDGSYWAIVVCNIAGSFLMGLLGVWLANAAFDQMPNLRLFLLTGLLGGFTTFSTFSQQAFDLLLEGRMGFLLLYVLFSVSISILMLAVGWRLGISIWMK